MKTPLRGADVGICDVLDATAYVAPALEILDTRIVRVDRETGRARTVIDTIADNAANAGIVLGGQAIRTGDVDMRWMGAIVFTQCGGGGDGTGRGCPEPSGTRDCLAGPSPCGLWAGD